MGAKKNHSLSLLVSVLAGLSSQVSFAGTMGQPVSPWNYVATLSAGPAWQNAGREQDIYLTPQIERAYLPNKSTTAVADVELFLGLQRALTPKLIGQLGIAGDVTSNAKISGIILDDADLNAANYEYSYDVQHSHVALKAKLLADLNYVVMPWISGSVGVGFNRAFSYRSAPLIEEAVMLPNLNSNTQTTFTYTVGAGVQRALDNNWQVGIGYEFADWGQSKLGRAEVGQTTDTRLSLNHLYTNGFMANITYVA